MKITTRQEWGARYGRGTLDPGPEPRVVIHHSYKPALSAAAAPEQEIAAVRAIERHHVSNNGWDGIGYNFLVAPSGRVYEGRGWKYKGAHAGPVNGSSIGVCLLIDGNTTAPGDAMVRAVRWLIAEGLIAREIAAGYTLSGHRDHMVGRSCPGGEVYARLQELRHDAGPIAQVTGPALVATVTPPNLDRIIVPGPEHVQEVARVRGLSAEQIRPGVVVVEVILRAMQRAGVKHAKLVADALADWLTVTS